MNLCVCVCTLYSVPWCLFCSVFLYSYSEAEVLWVPSDRNVDPPGQSAPAPLHRDSPPLEGAVVPGLLTTMVEGDMTHCTESQELRQTEYSCIHRAAFHDSASLSFDLNIYLW